MAATAWFEPSSTSKEPTMNKTLQASLLAIALLHAPHPAQAADLVQPRAAKLAPSQAALQRLQDAEALRQLAYSYGRGNDAVAIHHGDRAKGREAATAEYSKGFAPGVQVEVYALGGSTPIGRATGVAEWVQFVEKFYDNAQYTSTLHLMSNFDIRFTDANTAVMSAHALAPHFIRSAAQNAASAETSLELMNCRYTFSAKRGNDGRWQTTQLRIELLEIWRGPGFYPGGQGKGT